MNTTYYQATEAVLYSYSNVKSYICDLEVKLKETEKSDWTNMKAIQYDKINVRVFGISRITENAVIAKIDFIEEIKKEIDVNKKFIEDMDKVLKRLDKAEKRLVNLLYIKGLSKEKCMMILKFKKDKFYNLKNEAVKKICTSWFGVKSLNEDFIKTSGEQDGCS